MLGCKKDALRAGFGSESFPHLALGPEASTPKRPKPDAEPPTLKAPRPRAGAPGRPGPWARGPNSSPGPWAWPDRGPEPEPRPPGPPGPERGRRAPGPEPRARGPALGQARSEKERAAGGGGTTPRGTPGGKGSKALLGGRGPPENPCVWGLIARSVL